MSTPNIEVTDENDQNADNKRNSNDVDSKPEKEELIMETVPFAKLRGTMSRKHNRSRYTMNKQAIAQMYESTRIYEPTYRIESKHPFNVAHIECLVEKCTKENVSEYMPIYKGNNASQFAKELSQEIRFRVKLQHFDRYRLVIIVNVVEKQFQTVCMKVGFLWDSQRDLWAHYRHETKTFIVNVAVFGVYWD